MSDIVNHINIISVKTSMPNDKADEYSISLAWSLNGGYSCSYKGEYKITLYENSIAKKTESFIDTLGNKCTSITFSDIVIGKHYKIDVAVPESQGGVCSEKELVIIDYCKNLRGTFYGEMFEIFWEYTTDSIPTVQCTMSCPNKVTNLYYPCTTARYHKFRSTDFAPNDKIEVSLALTNNSKSVGPTSTSLYFYATPITITGIEISDNTSASKLKLTLQSAYSDISKVKLYFKKGKQIIACVSDISITKPANGDYLLDAEIAHSTISFDTLSLCSVYCALIDSNAESHLTNEKSIVPVAAPKLCVDSITKEKINVSVCTADLEFPPIGYELPDGTLLSKSTYSSTFKKDYSLKLRARYDIEGIVRKGTYSNTIVSFRSGYYPSEATADGKKPFIQLYQKSFSETFVTHSFKFELFKVRLTEKIEKGTLKLEVLDEEYKLTIDNSTLLTAKDYADFLAAVMDNIKPFGFYCLCDAVLRIAPHEFLDTPNLLCSFNSQDHIADLRPGLILNLSTSVYQPQYDPKIPNAAGYSSMFSSSYPISMLSDGDYLEFDRYLAAIAENMSISSSPNQATKIVFASSILDLLQPAVKQPFYRILHPTKITHDYSTETPYPSDNTVILTADSYSSILTACESIKSNPSAINNLSIPIVIFKGRSTLSIHMPIFFNNHKITVPVGSTIHDVLLQLGIYNAPTLKLFRRSSDGSELPVFVEFSDNPEEIVLISGDRIELD